MKRKTFDRVIDATNAILAFDNDQTEHIWRVALYDGKMLARLDVNDFDSGKIVMTYYEIPYEYVLETDKLYEEIVNDFVLCFGEAMQNGTLAEYNVFSEVAGSGDEGFAELLSFFGKVWGEFVQDAFYMFGAFIEMQELLDDASPEQKIEAERMADYHLVDKVFMHIDYADAYIDYDNGLSRYWQVAYAHDEIWYRSYSIIMNDDFVDISYDDWGHFSICDELAFDVLADAIADDIDGKRCVIEYDAALFELLGLEIEEEAD